MEQDKSFIKEAFTSTTIKILSELFYNTCNCLRDNPKKDKLLNPKYHRKKCPYKNHVEKIGLTFENE